MVSFIPKKIVSASGLGEELRRARNLKNISLDDASRLLRIRRDYLLALEAEDFDALPAGLYGRNYLKRYADFLGADKLMIKNFLENQLPDATDNNPFSQKVLKKHKFLVFPKIIRNILIGLAILICLLYLLFYFNKIILVPQLEVWQPDLNLMITETSILVTGWAEKDSEIKINGELILGDSQGGFSRLIDLKKGINTIEISAKKKYSQENKIIRQILVE